MAVALRGYTQGAVVAWGASVAWPSGTVAGDLALLHAEGGTTAWSRQGPQVQGWTACGYRCWYKTVDANDLLGPLSVNARHVKLQTFSGAGGVGRTSSQSGVVTSVAGAGVWVDAARPVPTVAPATSRLGAEWVDEVGWSQGAYYLAAPTPGWVALAGVAADAQCYAYEVLPLVPPGAPTLLAPGEGERVLSSGLRDYSWRHESPSPQIGFRLKMSWTDQVSGQPKVAWLGAVGGPPDSTTETSIGSSSQSVSTRPPGVGSYTWQVATQTASGWGPYSAARTLYADTAPTVSSVTVTATAGSLTPPVDWFAYPGSAAGVTTVLTGSRVRVTPASSASPEVATLYDSGTIAGDVHPRTVPASTPWTNGQSVKAWVTVYQTGGLSATLASAAFAVTWTPPAAPTVSATATTTPPTVTVSGLTAGDPVTIEQRLDGATWTALATRTATGATLSVQSPLAMTGAPVTFRARRSAVVSGVRVASSWATSGTITASPAGTWLVDDTDATSYLRLELLETRTRVLVESSSVTYGLGASGPRIDYTQPAGWRGEEVVICDTTADRTALLAWLSTHRVWWLVSPPNAGEPQPLIRAARTSPQAYEQWLQSDSSARTDMVISWVEQPL